MVWLFRALLAVGYTVLGSYLAARAFGPWTYDVWIVDSMLQYGIPYIVA